MAISGVAWNWESIWSTSWTFCGLGTRGRVSGTRCLTDLRQFITMHMCTCIGETVPIAGHQLHPLQMMLVRWTLEILSSQTRSFCASCLLMMWMFIIVPRINQYVDMSSYFPYDDQMRKMWDLVHTVSNLQKSLMPWISSLIQG